MAVNEEKTAATDVLYPRAVGEIDSWGHDTLASGRGDDVAPGWMKPKWNRVGGVTCSVFVTRGV